MHWRVKFILHQFFVVFVVFYNKMVIHSAHPYTSHAWYQLQLFERDSLLATYTQPSVSTYNHSSSYPLQPLFYEV